MRLSWALLALPAAAPVVAFPGVAQAHESVPKVQRHPEGRFRTERLEHGHPA